MFDNEFPPLGGGTGVVNLCLFEGFTLRSDVQVDLITSAPSQSAYVEMFSLSTVPEWLPNLIDTPIELPVKSPLPTALFVARWSRRKRPERFLELALRFPHVRFIAVGQGSRSTESSYDHDLRERFAGIPNLEMPGYIDRFTEGEHLKKLLSDSWILVNTSPREGLPLTFLEAAAFGCAILSSVDPDGFATRFGLCVPDEDYASGLERLLSSGALEKGRRAHDYVRENHEAGHALALHQEAYLTHARAKSL